MDDDDDVKADRLQQSEGVGGPSPLLCSSDPDHQVVGRRCSPLRWWTMEGDRQIDGDREIDGEK